jgi:4-amino-4-deoxychorismate lyase
VIFETISIRRGVVENISYHNKRLNTTQKELFGVDRDIDLSSYIDIPKDSIHYRCRVLYDEDIRSIEYIPYQPRVIEKILLVDSDIEYKYKYQDRDEIERLLTRLGNCDDLIIVRDGLLTDTSIANIAFLENDRWYTPSSPLLKGTTRARLIDEGVLYPKDICREDIYRFDNFAIMNAMVGFRPMGLSAIMH